MQPKRNIAARAGRWSVQHRKTAVIGWLLFVVLAFMGGNMLGTQSLEVADLGVGESGRADKLAAKAFPEKSAEVILVQGKGLKATDPAFKDGVEDIMARLETTPLVDKIVSPYSEEAIRQVSEDGRTALVIYELGGEKEDAATTVEKPLAAIEAIDDAHPELTFSPFGDASSNKEFQELFAADFQKATKTSLPLTMLILLFAAGALVAAGIPLFIGITGVLGTMGVVAAFSQFSPVATEINEIILLVGLAVGVDYALFYLRREREERAAGRTHDAAIMAAAATSGRAVLISGFTVMIAMAGMYLSGDPTFESFATGGILVVLVSVIGSLTVLPALLSMLGGKIDRGQIPFTGRLRRRAVKFAMWSRVTDVVLRRPKLSAVLSTGVLLALAIPALSLHVGNPGLESMPQDIPAIQTFNKMQDAFPDNSNGATVLVQADDVTTGPIKSAIASLEQEETAARGDLFPGEHEVEISADRTVARIDLPMAGDGEDAASNRALAALRGQAVPAAFGNLDGVTAQVTGNTASLKDYTDNMSTSIYLVVGFVLASAFLLLLVTFRSIVIPIKAILLNLLSVGAAYGVLVAVFQNTWAEKTLGFTSSGAITPWLPLFMFVILFGLSMDYHVFILSRVREAFDRGMSTEDAVASAIKSTSGVVTSAALVMVGVFAVFATLSMLEFKQLGIGLATAVLIDATIVRGVLLPASMTLLGDRNWWLPKSLGWMPKIEHEPEVVPATA